MDLSAATPGSDKWPQTPALCAIPAVAWVPKKTVPNGETGGASGIRTVGTIISLGSEFALFSRFTTRGEMLCACVIYEDPPGDQSEGSGLGPESTGPTLKLAPLARAQLLRGGASPVRGRPIHAPARKSSGKYPGASNFFLLAVPAEGSVPGLRT
jgi:hypothetical protein